MISAKSFYSKQKKKNVSKWFQIYQRFARALPIVYILNCIFCTNHCHTMFLAIIMYSYLQQVISIIKKYIGFAREIKMSTTNVKSLSKCQKV